ncbi:MAG TPA: hypothetical protein VFI40_04970 [Nocardioides sp.]|nr:hypothetical protein [Nocardioides sp.]
MSQTKFWALDHANTVRSNDSGTLQAGSGHSKRLYVGRHGGYNYSAYLKAGTLDWSGVGRIVSATLVVYTDDHLGEFESPATADAPQIVVRRLTGSFLFGDAADGVWESDDYTNPARTTSNGVTGHPSKADGAVNRIDITAIVGAWAPSSVRRKDGTPGGKATEYGLALVGTRDGTQRASFWSEEASDSLLQPQIELVYDLGTTVPNTPTSLSPSGAVASVGAFQADFSDDKATDTLAATEVEVYTSGATNSGQTVTGGTRTWTRKVTATNTEAVNGRSNMVPEGLTLVAGRTYKYRLRQYDSEGQVSLWTDLVSFSVSNTDPDAPTLTPDGHSYASLNGVLFEGGTFSDDDDDALLAYQAQLSAYPEGDSRWDDPAFLLWDTGKRYVAADSTEWQAGYGGAALAAGDYYWRARQWDDREGVSAWSYAAITLTADFDPAPGSQASVQIDPRAPWRIVIRDMGANRGPGDVVAILENAKAAGASIMFNSPGECHFTVPVDHPQISVIEPKQTHYAVEFYRGDGWREMFAGLVDDMDATETSVIFYGIDYLGLFDRNGDERWDASNPDLPASSGGSKYVNQSLHDIVAAQLAYNIALTDSPTGFIEVGDIATMDEATTIWSTFTPTLQFVAGLLDSHRQGTGKKTRVKVFKDTGGVYKVTVEDDPGQTRDALRLKYGELVQGYRVIPFGKSWATRTNAIGRTRDGLKVLYKSASAPGIDTSIWGRHSQFNLFDGVSDENDMIRRTKQTAIHAGKLGSQLALAVRSGVLSPLDGYDICDALPVAIQHGAVDTTRFGSGYWVAYGVAWEAGGERGTDSSQAVNLTLLPRDDTTAPDPDLIPGRPISTQAEWQVGWVPPDPLGLLQLRYALDAGYLMDDDLVMDALRTSPGRIYLDVSTGAVYELSSDGLTWNQIMGPQVPSRSDSLLVSSRNTLNADGTVVANITVKVS